MNSFERAENSFNALRDQPLERPKKASQILSPSESENSDIEFDDTQIETPKAIRDSSRIMQIRTTTSEVPLNDEPSSIKAKTPIKPIPPLLSERDLIANEKLISDDNQFTPHATTGSPSRIPRLQWSSRKAKTPERVVSGSRVVGLSDEEFDSSEDENASPQANADSMEISETRPEARASNRSSVLARSPRKSSPLRNEIKPSASSSLSPADEPNKSSTPREKRVEEILRSISSSIERLREAELEEDVEEEDDILDDDAAPMISDDDEDVSLHRLDSLLPSRNRTPSDLPPLNAPNEEESSRAVDADLFGDLASNTSIPRFDAPFHSEERESAESIGKPHTSNDGSPKRAGKLPRVRRGRINPKRLNLKSIGATKTKRSPVAYSDWPSEKWDKLIRLVKSSIPNEVIASNLIVVRELGCQNKAELAKRVAFLEKYLE